MLDTGTFDSKAGLGVSAIVDQHHLHIGSRRYVKQQGADVSPFTDSARQLAADAKTPFYYLVDNELTVLVAVSNPIRDALRTLSIRCWLQACK